MRAGLGEQGQIKEWLRAREIAEAGLPYMPTSERGVQLLAERECWDEHPSFARRRAAVGGGMEYHFRILPTLAQIAYVQRFLTVGTEPDQDTAEQGAVETLTGRAKRERDARLAVVAAFETFSAGLDRRLRLMSRLKVFCDKYNLGSIHVDGWVREAVASVSWRSLVRWRSEKRKGRIDALGVDRGAARKGTGVLDTANSGRVREWMLALIAQQPFLSAKRVRDLCRHEFGDEVTTPKGVVPMPPVRTFQHALKALKAENKVVLTKLTNPDKYRSIMAPAGVGTLRHISEPNQLWQIDASPVDALCVDGRHSLYACIDIATRRVVITVSRTPRASAVMLMIRKAVLAWGVPEVIKTDNGSDFVAQDTKRLFTALDIEPDVSHAYSPQEKAHVERVIKTFQHDCGPMLPGFIGHSVEDRKAIESRKSFAARLGESEAETFGVTLTAAELQRYIDEWVELLYHNQPHAGLKGKTPALAAMEATAQPRTVDARALDVLLMPVPGGGLRTVTKLGVRIDGYQYHNASLLPGERVFVRQDPADMGKAYAFSEDGAEFRAEVVCAELAGIHPETFIKAIKEQHAEMIGDMTRTLRRDMRTIAKGPALIERVLEVARRDVPNVVALPKVPQQHTTPQVAAALSATGSVERSTPSQRRADAEAFQSQLMAEAKPANVQPLRQEETPHQRFRRALEIERRMTAGEPVDDRDAGWLEGYRTGHEYRSMRMIQEDFGEQVNL